MADVFLAHQKGPAGFEKDCVIKRILPHLGLDGEFVQMFLDEARIAARLSHPNIVQIFDLGQVDGDYFLAMEYVDGVNLEQLLDAARAKGQPAVPWPLAVRIVADIAAGLDHAHNSSDSSGQLLGLVHRDVSPSNIMVSSVGAAKILDFGIAKAVVSSVKRSRTEVGTIKGKIPYMSPEQLQGFQLDRRSDVFSLGVILYEISCGSRPFPADNPAQLTMQILHEEPKPPEQLQPGYPERLKAIVLRALAKQPEGRWQTARELKVALESLLAVEHTACTSYDVEAYLHELVPQTRRTRQQVSGMEQTEMSQPSMGRVATPVADDEEGHGRAGEGADSWEGNRMRSEGRDDPQRPMVTGLNDGPQARLSDLAQNMDEDFEQQEQSMRRRRGGGSTSAVILLLVVATVVGLYFLRGYFMSKEAATAPDLGKVEAPKAVVDPPRPETPKAAVETPKTDAPKAAVETPKANAPKAAAETPKATPTPPKAKAETPKAKVETPRPRPEAKPKHVKEPKDEAPVELPRLNPPPEL